MCLILYPPIENSTIHFTITSTCRLTKLVKFIYYEKSTKFCEIFTLLLTAVHTVKGKVKISQNCVVFSVYVNFNRTFYAYIILHIWFIIEFIFSYIFSILHSIKHTYAYPFFPTTLVFTRCMLTDYWLLIKQENSTADCVFGTIHNRRQLIFPILWQNYERIFKFVWSPK